MKLPIVCTSIVWFVAVGVLFGQSTQPTVDQHLVRLEKTFETELEKVKKQHVMGRQALKKGYAENLFSLKQKFEEAGNLEPLLVVVEEQERFAGEQTVDRVAEETPDYLQRIQDHYVRRSAELDLARSRRIYDLAGLYAKALKRLQDSYTRKVEIDDALKVKAVRIALSDHEDVSAATERVKAALAEQEKAEQEKAEQYARKRARVQVEPAGKPAVRNPWVRSYSSGGRDVNGEFLGGSEIFHIESHKGKLYAATSYWMDENNTYYSNGKRNQWAQVLVKDSKNSPWREDYDTGDDRGVLRPEILQSVTFTKPNPDVNLLFLATYRTDHSKYYVDIMVRNDATGKWIKTTPHSGPKVPDAHDFSVRAMRVYTGRVTREERIFVTVGIQGVLSGVYDPRVPGWIRWYPFHPVNFSERALSICEANNSLVIGAGDAVWRRKDGPSPSYSIVHDLRDLVDRPVNPAIGGIRGMTTIDNPTGAGDSLLFLWSNADAKGACGSMYRLDPDGRGGYTRHEDVRLAPVIQKELGVYPSFILGSYSYVQSVRNPVTRKIHHLVGLYVQLNYGKHSYPTWDEKKQIYMGGLFAIRDEKGRYTINEVNGRHNGSDTPLTAVRAIEPSPFRNDTDVYFGGHDCANIMSTDFAWIYKAPLRTVLRLSK